MAHIPNDSRNVSTGKGKVGGYLFSAPAGTTLPTDAETALPDTYVNLGYVHSDGIQISSETESTDIKDLNGDTVLTVISSKKDSFNFKLMETSPAALKEIYGQSNVIVDTTTTQGKTIIKVKTNNIELPQRVYVMEFALTHGRKMRKVVPLGQITELGDQTYAAGEPISYEATVTGAPDAQGNTMYTYIEYNTPTTNKDKINEQKKGDK